MLRLIVLLLVVAGVAGFFTRPTESAMREAADAVLNEPQTLSESLQNIGANVAGDRAYDNYYVAARYTVSLDSDPIVQCWGAFTQVRCDRAQASS
jgi:hypothetical protein